MTDTARTRDLLRPLTGPETLVDSYRRLADVFHEVLSEQTHSTVLERIADTLTDLIPYDAFTIYQADESRRILIPLMARGRWADEIMSDRPLLGEGITGWAIDNCEAQLVNEAHLDPRVMTVPGTPENEPEALISVPLVARGAIKGALNAYRLGTGARFSEEEFELAKRFGDAAALALDNAQVRAVLELQAKTDSLTGLYNHRYFHERLRAELNRASRTHDSVAVLMLDIDDFKLVNDVYGHGAGDEVLLALADLLQTTVRTSDVVCRLGGEEFGVIMASCDAGDAIGLARRVVDRMAETDFEPSGRLGVSIGIAQGPEHAMNPRELVACAEVAMMTAKARGKNQAVLFAEHGGERPEPGDGVRRDVRSIAHLKMLQSLAGKLNRLNDVDAIGTTIVDELRMLIDYHACRVYVVDGDMLVPVAWRGDLDPDERSSMEALACRLGEGITGRAAETGEPVLVENALECEFAASIPGTEDCDESVVAVPFRYGKRVIGAVVVTKLGVAQFDEDDVRLLEVLAGHASVALENARLYAAQRLEAERAKASLEISNALLEFSRRLATAETLDEVLDRTVELAARLLGMPRSSVWLQERAGQPVAPRALHGYDEKLGALLGRASFPDEIARRFLEVDEPFVLTPAAIRRIEGAAGLDDGASVAIAPLVRDGDRLGCLAVATGPEGGTFDERSMRLLAGVAHQVRLAVANASSFESLENTFLSTVEALANALEANDEYTSSHARWITDTALLVGRELGLGAKELKRLELGALFHDIGKIGIPEAILQKPGPLTDDEWKIVRLHPELGARILGPIERLEEVCDIVRRCHEHWDGSGYPDGVAGEEIPVESRVILVCDAHHAMTTDRPYRRRLPLAEARRRLAEAAGTQFDPRVVEVFLGLGAPARTGRHG
ncbi:MAG TPA: diguanylate cyclase [Gaiellaceae bacterium]|nr:diguanylate cyclase [Gaiellaceae bacterium]